MLRYKIFVVLKLVVERGAILSSELASYVPPFRFPSVNFPSGLDWGSEPILALIFLFVVKLIAVVCLRPHLLGCSRKTRETSGNSANK